MTQISAVIITHNEERNIGRCLDSLQGVADEIIVVDSGSSDQTQSICENKGATFIHHDWQGYSEQKNFGNSRARFEYIYSIDADEALSDALKTALMEAKPKGLKGAYAHNRLTNYCGSWIRHSGWYPDTKTRLFPKCSVWVGEIHEALKFEKEMEVHFLAGDLLHYSYYNEEEHRSRAQKYSLLTAEKMFQNHEKSQWFKPYLSATSKFVGMYFIHLGFLDGKAGLQIARISAQANLVKYQALYKLQKGGTLDL